MIYAILGLIVLVAVILMIGRSRGDGPDDRDGPDDDDDDNPPGGRRRIRIPVRTNDRGSR